MEKSNSENIINPTQPTLETETPFETLNLKSKKIIEGLIQQITGVQENIIPIHEPYLVNPHTIKGVTEIQEYMETSLDFKAQPESRPINVNQDLLEERKNNFSLVAGYLGFLFCWVRIEKLVKSKHPNFENNTDLGSKTMVSNDYLEALKTLNAEHPSQLENIFSNLIEKLENNKETDFENWKKELRIGLIDLFRNKYYQEYKEKFQ